MGPLVVGGFLVEEGRRAEVALAGAKDSKLLSPAARERVYAALAPIGERVSCSLSPREVDAAVRVGGLNRLEAETFARLIRQCAPSRAYVDACDPVAPRFGRLVRALAGGSCVVVARHHADRDEPIVGAASIVAKVRRDAALRELAGRVGVELGSGYPSDAVTLAAVRAALAGADRQAPWIRHSWKTAERLKPTTPPLRLEAFHS